MIETTVLDDGNRGNFNQAMGIAERLPGPPPRVLDLSRLASSSRPLAAAAVALAAAPLPRPARRFIAGLVLPRGILREPVGRSRSIVSAGRRLAPYNLLASWLTGALAVQVLHPEYLPLRLFGLVVIPRHDLERYRIKRVPANVEVISGATNRVRPSPVRKAGGRPVLAVLVGGEDRNYTLPESWATELCRRLVGVSRESGARVLLATSRRTTPASEAAFRRLAEPGHASFELVLAGETDENPVGRFLAEADLVMVTEDSVNMVSEAATSGRPVLVLPVPRKSGGKLVFDRTMEALASEGHVRLGDRGEPRGETIRAIISGPPPRLLDETGRVAARVAALSRAGAG